MDYLLVSQTKPTLEHYRRQTSGGWLYYSVHSLGEYLYLASIDCTLRLVEVYDRIVFPAAPDELPAQA
jgi:Uma2 family endonuclease